MATLTSISLIVGTNPVTIGGNSTFYVLANYSDNTSVPVTDSCSFTLGTTGITAIPTLELWVDNDGWGSDNENWGDKDY